MTDQRNSASFSHREQTRSLFSAQKVALMACDFPTVREKVLTRFPIMRSSTFERRTLFERASERHSSPDGVVTSFEPASIVPNS